MIAHFLAAGLAAADFFFAIAEGRKRLAVRGRWLGAALPAGAGRAAASLAHPGNEA